MTSLPLARVFQCLLTFAFVSDWRKSDSSVEGEPQGNWRWNSISRDVVGSSPSFPAPPPERLRELARRLNKGSKHFPFGDHFNKIDLVRRKLLLVNLGIKRIKKYSKCSA